MHAHCGSTTSGLSSGSNKLLWCPLKLSPAAAVLAAVLPRAPAGCERLLPHQPTLLGLYTLCGSWLYTLALCTINLLQYCRAH